VGEIDFQHAVKNRRYGIDQVDPLSLNGATGGFRVGLVEGNDCTAFDVGRGGDGKLPFALCTSVKPCTSVDTTDRIRFWALAVGTNATMSPNDRFKKLSASIFIWKSCSELIDIHNIFSFHFWRRYYQIRVTDSVTLVPF
jgi:hypothetical protein